MKHEILYQPTFAVARIMLEDGEAFKSESGAMMGMSPNINLESSGGGLGKMFGRMLTGESMFQSTYTAQGGSAEVLVAPPGPGDIFQADATQPLMVTRGCYLCGDVNLNMETKGSFKGLVGGEGLFMMRISGPGLLLLSSFGAIQKIDLNPGQTYVVDTGHLVAFDEGVSYELNKAAKGLMSTLKSGEGLVARMTGPGSVYVQTRTPATFAGWLSPFLPQRN
jgi:uncharacterized protein (TIGR00266 family)